MPDAIGRGPGRHARHARRPRSRPTRTSASCRRRLQLEKFKKVSDNPELLKKLGYTPQDYDRFLKGFEEVVKQERTRSGPGHEAQPGPACRQPRG